LEAFVAESMESESGDQKIDLKDPWVAGILAWLIPGLGHFYQGRNAKGALYAICILGTFVYGLYLGGSKEVGYGRAVYFSFRPNDWRLPWLCQIGVGLPTVPMTLLQWQLVEHGHEPILDGFMAQPPMPASAQEALKNGPPGPAPTPDKMNLAWISRLLVRYFDLATAYTMIAGLLNVLAIYDACCGPVPAEGPKRDGKSRAAAEAGAEDKKS
jgi:hypothetical protein